MKPTIDLTENLDFGARPADRRAEIRRRLRLLDKEWKFPWTKLEDLHGESKELVLTGSSSGIRSQKEYRRRLSGMYCECCGKNTENKPWTMRYMLCFVCDLNLELGLVAERDFVFSRLETKKKGGVVMIKLQLIDKNAGFVVWESIFNTKEEAEDKKKEFAHWENKNLRFSIV